MSLSQYLSGSPQVEQPPSNRFWRWYAEGSYGAGLRRLEREARQWEFLRRFEAAVRCLERQQTRTPPAEKPKDRSAGRARSHRGGRWRNSNLGILERD